MSPLANLLGALPTAAILSFSTAGIERFKERFTTCVWDASMIGASAWARRTCLLSADDIDVAGNLRDKGSVLQADKPRSCYR